MTKITKQFLLLALLFLPWAAKVQAQCDPGVSSCTISFEMADSYGDGWNDCTISVYQGSTLRGTVTLASGSSGEASVTICSDDSVRLEWFGVSSYPNYSGEASFTVYNGDGIAVTSVSSGANLTSGATFATFMPVCPTCIRPTALTFSDIDSSSATISWTPSGDETSWLLTIGNDTYMVNSTSYSVSDLNAMTAYNVSVRALCSASDTSSALSGSFTTGCGTMPIPYSVDWESIPYNGAWPDCWTRITAYNTDPSVNYNYNHTPGGSYSMYLQASYGYNMFASSKIPLAGDEIYVSYFAYLNNASAIIEAGVMTDITADSTFIPLDSITSSTASTYTWLEREFNTSSLDPSQEYYLAFRAYGTSSWSALGAIDDIAISQYTGCERPAYANVDSVGSYAAVLSWPYADGSNGYTVYYGTENDINSSDIESEFVNDTTVTLDVDPQTTYYAWVVTECGSVVSPARAFGSFHTDCADAKCEVSVKLEQGYNYSYYNSGVQVWQDGAMVASWQSNGTFSVEVCDEDTVTFTYIAPSSSYYANYITIYDGGSAQVLSDTSTYLSNGQTLLQLGDPCPTCIPPANLHAVERTDESITIAWDPRSDESDWLLWINDSAIGSVSDTFFTFDYLDANTSYTIALQSVCSSDDSSSIISKTFKTACSEMTIPYTEDWENGPNGGWPDCWDRILSHGTDPSTNAQHNHTPGGNRAMFLLAEYDYNMFVSGVVPLSGDAIKVSFWLKMPSYGNAEVLAGVMTNPDDTSTFIPLVTVTGNNTSWTEYEFNTSTLDGNASYYVAFRYYGEYSYNSGAIDDITISEYSPCDRPATASVIDVQEYSATLAWNGVSIATGYWVYYGTTNNFEDATAVFATDTAIQLNNLLPQTTYYAWIVSACGSEVSGDSRPTGAFTTLTTCAPVTNVTLVNVGYTAAQLSWDYDLSTGFAPQGVEITLIDNSDANALPIVSYVTGNTATFTGLAAAHSYSAQIRTLCQTLYQVDTAAVVNFQFGTLLCPGIEISSPSSSANASSNPLNNYYNYSYAQNLYLASEIPSTVDTIYSIAFNAASAANRTVNIDVYMGNSTLSSLSTSAFESSSNMTLVASNYELDLSQSGWHTINLNNPFVWNGTDNLIVAIDNNTGSYSSTLNWYTHPTSGTQSVWSFSDGTNYDPASISSFTSSANNAADIQFFGTCQAPSCEAPMLTIANVDSMGFTARWVGVGEATNYVITLNGVTQSTTTADSIVFQNLMANTAYTVGIGAICTSSTDTMWSYANVKTSCGAMILPYYEGFENDPQGSMVSCWSIIHDYTFTNYYGNSTYYPYISGNGYNSSNALALCANGTSMVASHAIPNSGLDGDQYHISFFAKLGAGASIASAGVMTDVNHDTTYVPLATITADDTWHRYDIYTTGMNASDIYHFAVRYDGTNYYDDYKLYIDSLSIELDLGCHFPSNITATTTNSSATLNWTNDGVVYDHIVAYRLWNGSNYSYSYVGNATSLTLNNLQSAATYLFRVGNICNGDTLWAEITAITDCGIMSLPYYEDFSAYAQDVLPPCWVYNSTMITHYDGGLFFRSNSGPAYSAVLPQLDNTINKLEIEFKTKLGPVSQGDAILVGVADANGTFIQWLDTLTDPNQSRSAFVWMTYRYDTYTGTGTRIALGRLYSGGDWALIDDITVRMIPTCTPPENITGHNLADPDSSYFTWTHPDDITTFQVYVDTVTADTTTIPLNTLTTITGNSYLIPTGILTGGGKYKFFIRTDCVNSHSPWSVITFGAGEFIMAQSGTDTVTSCGLVVYDNGGPIAGYYSQTSSSLVIYPAGAGLRAQVYGAYLSLYNDGTSTLTIYDGDNTNGTILYQTSYSGPTTMYDSIVTLPIATSSTGPLTISFSAGTYVNPGYELYVRCIPIVSCDDPTYIQANNITANEASLSWYGNAANYNIYYRQYGSSNWNMTSSSSASVTLSGLASATTYEVQIRAICTDIDSSNLSDIFSFNTECNVINISTASPLVEDFEGIQVPPTCWQLVYGTNANANDNPVIFDASAAYSGTKGLRFSSANATASGNYNQTLITPELSSNSDMSVLFYVRASEGTEMFRVGYSTTGSEAANINWQPAATVGTTWMHYRLDIPSTTKYVAINYYAGAPRHHLYVDSMVVTINDGNVDCAEPIISSISATTSTITVNYMNLGPVQAGIVEGDVWDDATTAQDIPDGTSYTFTHLFSNNNPLLDTTTYTVGLRSVCGNDFSDWVTMTISTRELVCNAPTDVTVSNVNGNSATISWNGNGAEEWELSYSDGTNENTLTSPSTSVTLNGLTTGATYSVRVRAICGQRFSEWSNTVTFTPSDCPIPMGLTTRDITINSATIAWNAGNESEWEIAYGPTSSFNVATATHVRVTNNEYNLTDLVSNYNYTWTVRTICSEDAMSGWSSQINFTTLPNPQGIDNSQLSTLNSQLLIYPNPASDNVNISISGINGEVAIMIVDINGRTVLGSSLRPAEGNDFTLPIDISTLAPGAYFVRISTNGGIDIVKKLIVK